MGLVNKNLRIPSHALRRHREMVEAYGFGLFALPPYRRAVRGEWRLELFRGGVSPGFATRTCHDPVRHVLLHGRTVWMSTGLMEMESHAWHVHRAHGVVAVAGLGMGMFTFAAAMKDDVERVVVADLSPEVIAIMREATRFDDWPFGNKVEIVEADAVSETFAHSVLSATGGRRPDYLYADIWPDYPNAQAAEQTERMAYALDAADSGWWGQEVEIGERLLKGEDAAASLPDGYAVFCRDVATTAGRVPAGDERRSLWRRLFS